MCTQTAKDSVEVCEPCVADSECVAGYVCVSMQFDGVARDSAYCLPIDEGGCSAPYPNAETRTTVSGDDADICTINESLATCEAVLDYGAPCGDASDCGADGLDDGLCEPIEFGGAACTLTCSGFDSMECPNEENFFVCATAGPNGEKWCGGY
jgi:hypothetical protein